MDDQRTQKISVLSESTSHWIAQLTKHILQARIGHLSYECQNPAEVFELEQLNLKGKIDAMEFERFENATSRGINNSIMSSPKRENFLIERKFTGF